jgi:D-alanine-D-alanine ligase
VLNKASVRCCESHGPWLASKARTADEFEACCRAAFRFDSKILIERCVAPVREIECSMLEDANADVRASQLGEIVAAGKQGFYSYDAKYIDGDGVRFTALTKQT